MDLSGAGTAIMLAIAAGLWFLYLVPTWVRRREYLATERTATRLQQTIRIMAETAEVPESVRISATAREAARAERALRAQQRRADAMVATPGAIRRQRMRRTRRLASLLMVGATILGLVQIWLMASTGVTVGSWLVLAATLAAGGVAIGVQRRLDARTMPRARVEARRRTGSGIPASLLEGTPVRPEAPAPWTPIAVPAPLYRSRPPVQRARPELPAAQLVREAAAEPPRPAAPVQPISAAKSRFAAMGIVDATETAAPDLDEVLRRRRSAG
ncbi:MAG TPA: hypothetical protein VNR36_02960 [Pseudolysinimonas sp.]|nr:hypothetical protein [Pseudolysinimonas sp.]